MTMIRQIKRQLEDLGLRATGRENLRALGIELTVCQLIVVILSIGAIAFLFIPLLNLQNFQIVLIFCLLSLSVLSLGVWFWTKKAEICENPEDYQD